MQKHFVSVALCTYNGEKYIEEQLESILNQDQPIDEIVVGDDGSTDDTVKIVKKVLENANVSYQIIQNEKNLGYRKNFENVILHTKGDIIFLSDQDDVWMNNKVSTIVNAFDKSPKCLLIFSDGEIVDSELNKLSLSLWDAVDYNRIKRKRGFKTWLDILLNGYYITGAATAIKRELFEKAYPFSNIWHHDGWLAINAAIYGNIMAEPMSLFLYRQHSNNQIGVQTDLALNELIKKRWLSLKSNIKIQNENHKKVLERYLEIYNVTKNDISDTEKRKVEKCIAFHKDLSAISNKKKLKSLKLICKNCINGNYYKYYARRWRIMIVDVLFCFIK